MISIDYQSRTPLYEQIVDRFQLLILKGVLTPDTQMPSVRSLAVSLSINPNTIQKAYAQLEQQGYIYPVKGKGNFVADPTLLKEKKKEFYLKDLEKMLRGAQDLGITAGECQALIQTIYHREVHHD